VGNLLAVLAHRRPERVPLLELKIDDEVISALLGETYVPWSRNAPAELRTRHVQQYVSCGTAWGMTRFAFAQTFPSNSRKTRRRITAGLSRGQRQWQNEATGPIQTWADLDRYPWPTRADIDSARSRNTSGRCQKAWPASASAAGCSSGRAG